MGKLAGMQVVCAWWLSNVPLEQDEMCPSLAGQSLLPVPAWALAWDALLCSPHQRSNVVFAVGAVCVGVILHIVLLGVLLVTRQGLCPRTDLAAFTFKECHIPGSSVVLAPKQYLRPWINNQMIWI